jgi:Protein of unknown function (DUF4232)
VRALVAALAVVFSLAASGAVTHASAAGTCSAATLVVWLDTQGDHAAGSTYFQLRFTNLGPACTLRGFPGVSAVDLAGRQLGRPASRDRSVSSRAVTLTPGASAKAVLRLTNVHNFPQSACRPASAAGLRVYPPNETRSKLVPFPFGACAGSPVFLFVRALQKS